MIEMEPGFTISTRMPAHRDDGFRQERHDVLKSLGLPE
jgi:hypothetical protein